MSAETRTTCPYCGVGCGVVVTPTHDGGVSVRGDEDHPANFGRLCSKGAALGETLALEGRLLQPRLYGKTANWDEALATTAQNFSNAIERYGPDSVAFYVSGQLLTEDYYVANKLMKGFIGSANIDTNSRLCMASSVAGHRRAFGNDTVPGVYEDLELADLIVLVGSNLAWCHPVLFQRIAAARTKRPNLRIVTIDPRRTKSADFADLHLPISTDGDVALLNGLLSEIAQRDALNQSYIEAHTQGFSDAVEAARRIVDVAGQTRLTADDLQRFYDLWINTDRVVTVYSQGVNQSEIGTDKVNAIINCHLATGRIGRPGMGPFSVTGQPNAMGGREVGGLANMLANHLSLENADHRDLVRDYWDAPTIATKPGLKAVDLFQACQDGRIKALWIMSTNPVVSMPDADAVRSALETCPFVVVSDIFGDTDTAALADVVFPATAWGEKSGTVTNSERRISRQRPFLPAPGDARPDWQIISDVAGHMGWGAAFDFQEPRQIFNEYAGLSERAVAHGVDLDLTGLMDLSGPAYDALAPVQWPVHRMTDDNVIQRQFANRRFFADGGFFTDTGRARFVPVQNRRIERPQDREDGLILNTGRVRDQWHTMTRTARAPALNRHYAEPFAEIHPRDADRLRVSPADLVIVRTNRGQIIVRALVTDRTQEGTIFVPMHWTAQFASAGRVGTLISPKTDPVSGQPALKMSVAAVERFEAGWYGFVVANRALSLDCAYWAKAPIENGWRAEMAGLDIPEDWEAYARTVLDCAVEEIVSVVDAAGSARIAAISNGIIVGAFFVAPRPVEVSRSHVLDLMGTASDPAQLIAGRPGGSSIDPGPIVCACMNVGANTILHAIQTQGLSSVAAIGEAVQAGTSCGSCKPEVQALLAASSPPVAAE